jgi:hypothetical protein
MRPTDRRVNEKSVGDDRSTNHGPALAGEEGRLLVRHGTQGASPPLPPPPVSASSQQGTPSKARRPESGGEATAEKRSNRVRAGVWACGGRWCRNGKWCWSTRALWTGRLVHRGKASGHVDSGLNFSDHHQTTAQIKAHALNRRVMADTCLAIHVCIRSRVFLIQTRNTRGRYINETARSGGGKRNH